MNKVTINSIISRNIKHLSTAVGEDQVILDTENNTYFGLENVASRIWQLTENRISLEEIIKTIQEEFEVQEQKCTVDCSEFIQLLADRGLVEISD